MTYRILIAGTVDVAPEKREAALLGAVPHIKAALEERGCVAYSWTADLSRPGRICVFEEWTDEAALAVHLSAAPYKNMLAHLGGVGILGADTRKYRVDVSEPVYDPQGRPRADFFTLKS